MAFEEFQEANDMHRMDVSSVMYEISKMVDNAGEMHDCTKKSQERMFWKDLQSVKEGKSFIDGEWYKLHCIAERHHLNSKCPSDVNLIDVIEMIVDCTVADMTRSEISHEIKIDNNILQSAVQNTVELIKSMVKVVNN